MGKASKTEKMNQEELKKLEDSLYIRFDESSKNQAMDYIVSHRNTFEANHLYDLLLRGRNAKATDKQVKALINNDSSIKHVKNDDIDDDTIIEEIKLGRAPSLFAYPRDRWLAIYEKIKVLVSQESNTEAAQAFYRFLLDFEQDTVEPYRADLEVIQLAKSWCIDNLADPNVREILYQLLTKVRDRELIQYAQISIRTNKRDVFSAYLVVAIMECSSKRDADRFYRKYSRDFKKFDYILIPSYLGATGCSRRSFKIAKERMLERGRLEYPLYSFGNKLYKRRHIYKWLHRYFFRNKNNAKVNTDLISCLGCLPSKPLLSIAKEKLLTSDEMDKLDIAKKLIYIKKDRESIDIAKDYINKYPDSPNSFQLMTYIAEFIPEKSVPWLQEWSKTAIRSQRISSIRSILEIEPNKDNISVACDLVSDIVSERLYLIRRSKLLLMLQIQEVDPDNEILNLAFDLKERFKGCEPRHLRKLLKRLEDR